MYRHAEDVDGLRLELEMWKEKYRKRDESAAEAVAAKERLV